MATMKNVLDQRFHQGGQWGDANLNYTGVNVKSREIEIWHIDHWQSIEINVISENPKAPATVWGTFSSDVSIKTFLNAMSLQCLLVDILSMPCFNLLQFR